MNVCNIDLRNVFVYEMGEYIADEELSLFDHIQYESLISDSLIDNIKKEIIENLELSFESETYSIRLVSEDFRDGIIDFITAFFNNDVFQYAIDKYKILKGDIDELNYHHIDNIFKISNDSYYDIYHALLQYKENDINTTNAIMLLKKIFDSLHNEIINHKEKCDEIL